MGLRYLGNANDPPAAAAPVPPVAAAPGATPVAPPTQGMPPPIAPPVPGLRELPPAAAPAAPATADWWDIAKGAGSGVEQFVAGIIGSPASFLQLLAKAGQYQDLPPEEQQRLLNLPAEEKKKIAEAALKQMPASSVVESLTPKALIEAGEPIGTKYKPTTREGEIAQTVGQVAPALLTGPAGWATKLVQIVGTVGAMEMATEATKGKTWEAVLRERGIDPAKAAEYGFDPREMDKNGPSPETVARTAAGTVTAPAIAAGKEGIALGPGSAAQTRINRAGEFGIDLSRGQATRDVGQLSREEAYRNEARGPQAGQTMRGFDERQMEQVEAARQRLLEQEHSGTTQTERLQNVTGAVRGAEEQSAGAVDTAYTGARATDAAASNEAVGRIPQDIRTGLARDNYVINEGLTPHANEALRIVDDAVSGGESIANRMSRGAQAPGANQPAISLDSLENVRKQLVQLEERAKAKPEDMAAVRAVKRQWDASLEQSANDGLLRGDPQGLQLWRDARALRRQHGETFETDFIKKLTDRDNPVSANEIGNAIIGVGKVGEKGESIRLAGQLRNIIGEDSPQWQQVRESVLHQLTGGMEGDSPRVQAGKIREFAGGRGDEYANAMFTQAERGRMLRYADTLDDMTTPRAALNPSGTAHTLARLISERAPQIAAGVGTGLGATLGHTVATRLGLPTEAGMALGATVGYPAGQVLGAAGELYRNVKGGQAAREATLAEEPSRIAPSAARGATAALIDLQKKYPSGYRTGGGF